MNRNKMFDIIRSFGYTTSNQTSDIVSKLMFEINKDFLVVTDNMVKAAENQDDLYRLGQPEIIRSAIKDAIITKIEDEI